MAAPPDPLRLLSVLDSLRYPRVLVVGDLILDRYVWGRAERISPEAPVPILLRERSEDRLGGAAAVAGLLKALECNVVCLGLVGDDADGQTLRQLLEQRGIDSGYCIPDPRRPTTLKQRFLSGKHGHAQLLRLDCESCAPLSAEFQSRWQDGLPEIIAECDAVLISDYAKGVCTAPFLQTLIRTAQTECRPILVDPARGKDYSIYKGVSLLVPNRLEAELITGSPIDGPRTAIFAATAICRQTEVAATIIKLDAQGIVWACADGSGEHCPTQPRAVYDVTGAGDSVLAMLGLCLAQGVSLPIACQLANIVGGIQVERIGVSPISREEIRDDLLPMLTRNDDQEPCQTPISKIVSLDRAALISARAQAAGRTTVFTNGCFAALHAGHVACLRQARSLGDVLIVAVNSSKSIRRLKGDCPIISDPDRLAMLAALDCVDFVMSFDDDTPHRILQAIRPNLLVKGSATEVVIGREIVEAYGGVARILSSPPAASNGHVRSARCLVRHSRAEPSD
jgi:D-beta-D-heptose 7-phosphate kinase/D-beta-D-heptose 1-phosphate adenosyltransferase